MVCGGIQPAGELMIGKGATSIADLSIDGLTRMFVEFSEPARLTELRKGLDPEAVPCWSQFTHGVVKTILA